MTRLSLLAVPFALLTLAGCATNSQNTFQPEAAPVAVAPAPVVAGPTPAQTTAAAVAATDVSPFVEPAAVALMTPADKSQASSAQFYALQFGRPGAPRAWTSGVTKGQVTVGPYVRVNNLDCREFTHAVTVSGTAYSRQGTACREQNGTWTVVEARGAA